MEILRIVTLSLSGLLLFFVGSMRLTNPIKAYLKNSGIKLEKDVSLLNEMRGVSAVMLSAGIIILFGTVIQELRTISHSLSILLFIGFFVGRLVSIILDGKPNKQTIQNLIFEPVFGLANIFCLINTLS